jgi:mannose/fructose-specific phosphotransferase system component IIA
MSKHTKGPWKKQQHSANKWLVITDTSGETVARVYARTDLEREQYAELIAASPKLLEALVTVREWMIPGMDFTDDIGQAIKELADKAIAQARGEEEVTA